MTTTLIDRAKAFATAAHAGQTRWDGETPYIDHPEVVASYLRVHWRAAPDWAIAAAWLHDTVEDTDTTIHDIHREFGGDVADLVLALTKPGLDTGNRAARMAAFNVQVRDAGKAAHLLKLCDRLSNLRDEWEGHWKFALRYASETLDLLAAVDDHGTGLKRKVRDAMNILSRTARAHLKSK